MKLHKFKIALILPLMAAFSQTFISCEDDDKITPEFIIEGNPTSFDFAPEAFGVSDGYIDRDNAARYTVRSNSYWHVEIDGEAADWVKVFPKEATGDAYFCVGVEENTRFDARTVNIKLIIDGQAEPVIIPVNQKGAAPKLQASRRITVTAAGGETSVNVVANLDWTAEKIDDPDSEWLQVKGVTESSIILDATAREIDEPRTARVALLCPRVPEKNDTLTIVQYGPSVLLYEEFDWLSGYPMSGNTWYSTSGSQRMDSWTDSELANGWSCWTGKATVGGSTSSNPTVYGGAINNNGWAKLGRTSVNGNLASPRLLSIPEGVKMDVKVSFNACPYVATGKASKSSAYDSNRLYVFVYGGGEIEGANSSVKISDIQYAFNGNWETQFKPEDYPEAETPADAKKKWYKAAPRPGMNGTHQAILYTLMNYPNSKYVTVKMYDDPLYCDDAHHEFIVRNATANTQIVFQAGEWNDTWADYDNETFDLVDLTGKNHKGLPLAIKCNRVFIDNVIVRDLSAIK